MSLQNASYKTVIPFQVWSTMVALWNRVQPFVKLIGVNDNTVYFEISSQNKVSLDLIVSGVHSLNFAMTTLYSQDSNDRPISNNASETNNVCESLHEDRDQEIK